MTIQLVIDEANGLAFTDHASLGFWYVGSPIYTGIHIHGLRVHPDHRREGHGRSIMQLMIERTNLGIDLRVRTDNLPAVRLYQSLGFVTVDERRFKDGHSRFLMVLEPCTTTTQP